MRQFKTDLKDSAMFLSDNFIDEDSFASDSATKAPSQQSVKAYVDGIRDPDVNFYYQTDWISVNAGDWSNTVSGGTISRSQVGLDTTENCIGVLTLNTGTGTSGYAQNSMSTNQVKIGTCAIVHKFRIALSALSDGTDTYTVYIGLGSNDGGSDLTDGCYFRYTHSVASGNWEAVTSASSSRTASDTGVAAGTTHSIFEVRINQAGTSVTYYIDGALVATITTNIPSTTIGFVHKIVKSAGTTERTVYEDWTDISITRATAR
jgi:hypothetical protein